MSESQAFKPTPEYGQEALRDHIVDKASAARRKYGGAIDYPTMLRILDDTDVVRYPTGIRFDAGPLERGEFALLQPLGDAPASGFCLFVHPAFQERLDALPLLIAYHIVRINYGEIATHVEAELFGATLLGLEVEDYYETLCGLADSIPAGPP